MPVKALGYSAGVRYHIMMQLSKFLCNFFSQWLCGFCEISSSTANKAYCLFILSCVCSHLSEHNNFKEID